MKFRSSWNRQTVADPQPIEYKFGQAAPAESGSGKWSTAFLMVGSALVGATALALWNRRTITSMRAQIETMSAKAQSIPTLDSRLNEEIF